MTVRFHNSQPDIVKLRADFDVNGIAKCASKEIALVQLVLGGTVTNTPGHCSLSDFVPNPVVRQVNNPPSGPPIWVTSSPPGFLGSDCTKFTFNGTNQAAEPVTKAIRSGSEGFAGIKHTFNVTWKAPEKRKTALQSIQVGFIQHGSGVGSATYDTTPGGGMRTLAVPANQGLDWTAAAPCNVGIDDWPWYPPNQTMGQGTTGQFQAPIVAYDTPQNFFPAEFSPNAGGANAHKAIVTGSYVITFTIRLATRTTSTGLGAENKYFELSHNSWTLSYKWPIDDGARIITPGGQWDAPSNATEIPVNIIPLTKLLQAPFGRWEPDMP